MRLHQIIEEKEDTAKKLAEAAGQPTKHYLFAPEINRLTRIVRSIYQMINLDIGGVNPARLKDLGDIADSDYLAILNTLEAVNYLSPSFVKFTNGEVNYVYSFIGEEGVYGEGAGQFTQEDFVLLEEDDESPISSFTIPDWVQPATSSWEAHTPDFTNLKVMMSESSYNATFTEIKDNPIFSGITEFLVNDGETTTNRDIEIGERILVFLDFGFFCIATSPSFIASNSTRSTILSTIGVESNAENVTWIILEPLIPNANAISMCEGLLSNDVNLLGINATEVFKAISCPMTEVLEATNPSLGYNNGAVVYHNSGIWRSKINDNYAEPTTGNSDSWLLMANAT